MDLNLPLTAAQREELHEARVERANEFHERVSRLKVTLANLTRLAGMLDNVDARDITDEDFADFYRMEVGHLQGVEEDLSELLKVEFVPRDYP